MHYVPPVRAVAADDRCCLRLVARRVLWRRPEKATSG